MSKSASVTGQRLIHYHIYKNAGSSIDRLLKASFGPGWAPFEGTHAADVQTSGQLAAFLAAHPNLTAVSSHLARPPLPGANDRAIVMLRHPIDRVRSVFAFAKRDANQPDHQRAHARSLADYVRWALDSADGGVVIRNYQVVHLSAASFRTPHIYDAVATDADLQEAISRLVSFGVFGIVRRFAASCSLFMRRYGGLFPQLRLHDTHDNASDVAKSELDAIAEVQAALGWSLYGALLAANALDLRLYEWAQAQFTAMF